MCVVDSFECTLYANTFTHTQTFSNITLSLSHTHTFPHSLSYTNRSRGRQTRDRHASALRCRERDPCAAVLGHGQALLGSSRHSTSVFYRILKYVCACRCVCVCVKCLNLCLYLSPTHFLSQHYTLHNTPHTTHSVSPDPLDFGQLGRYGVCLLVITFLQCREMLQGEMVNVWCACTETTHKYTFTLTYPFTYTYTFTFTFTFTYIFTYTRPPAWTRRDPRCFCSSGT
jgi:hypothetical protein